MSQQSIVIASAARTAVGSFMARLQMCLHTSWALQQSRPRWNALKLRLRSGRGHSRPGASGRRGAETARQAAMKAGIPQEKTAWGLNQLWWLRSARVALGMQQIALGDAKIIVAGGQESMSMAPHCAHLRGGTKMGDMKMIDTMIKDGHDGRFYGYHMGTTAENSARQWQLSRDEQDQFAVASQNKAEARAKGWRFADEITPIVIKGRKGDVTVDSDEYIRAGATLDSMTKLRPAFDKEGTVTAGNASGINVGAAVALLMSEEEAVRRGSRRWCVLFPGQRQVSIRRSWAPAPFLPRAARLKRLAGRLAISISSRPMKPLLHRLARSTRTWAGIRPSLTSMAVPLLSVTRSALPVLAFSTRWSSK